MSVLVLEDELHIRKIIVRLLRQLGFSSIYEVSDGVDGMKELLRVRPSLILCDIRMPKVNGVECVDYLKKNAPGIPVVVVTAFPDAELAASLLKKGIKDYLVKPVSKEKLVNTVKDIVSAGKDIGL